MARAAQNLNFGGSHQVTGSDIPHANHLYHLAICQVGDRPHSTVHGQDTGALADGEHSGFRAEADDDRVAELTYTSNAPDAAEGMQVVISERGRAIHEGALRVRPPSDLDRITDIVIVQ